MKIKSIEYVQATDNRPSDVHVRVEGKFGSFDEIRCFLEDYARALLAALPSVFPPVTVEQPQPAAPAVTPPTAARPVISREDREFLVDVARSSDTSTASLEARRILNDEVVRIGNAASAIVTSSEEWKKKPYAPG